MLTHSLLRSFSAAITVAGVWIAIPNFGRAQDILKELEENEHGQIAFDHRSYLSWGGSEGAKSRTGACYTTLL